MCRRSPISGSTGSTTGWPPAYTAALVLDAAPNGMVPDPLAKQILDSIGARAVAMKMGERRRMLGRVDDMPPPIDDDLRHAQCRRRSMSIVDAFKMMLDNKNDVMRVVGPAPMGGEYIELIMDEPPLRKAMLRYSGDILLLSLLISGITAALVYLALHYMFVRPMRRITANMMAFRADPENADRIIVPSARADEIGVAERELADHAERACLDAASEEPARRARPRGVQDQSRSAQPAGLGATVLRPAGDSCPIPACSASRRS